MDKPRIDYEASYRYSIPGADEYPVNGKVIKRLIRFELPFVILVADTFADGVLGTADEVILTGKPYVTQTVLGEMSIWFQKKISFPYWVPEANKESLMGENFGSISKNGGYSEVLVQFAEVINRAPDLFPENVLNAERLTTAAIEGLNLFLTNYKVNNLKYYIPYVTDHSVTLFKILEIFEDGSVYNAISTRLFEKIIPFEQTIGEDKENKIRQDLVSAERNYIHELYSEVWNKMVLQQWRSAIIDSVTLLEAWLIPYLEERYKGKGLSNTAIKKKFKTGHRNFPAKVGEIVKELVENILGSPLVSDSVQEIETKQSILSIDQFLKSQENHFPMGIIEVCEKLVFDATEFAFHDTEEYSRLKQFAIAPRNKLVHGERLHATREEAHSCIRSVTSAVGIINFMVKSRAILDAATPGIVNIPDTIHPFPHITDVEDRGNLTIPGFSMLKTEIEKASD